MKIYIDIEATQPENEIIAIGAVAENGASFYSLVKPRLSSISPFVCHLTHIAADALKEAEDINKVMIKFDQWLIEQEPDFMKCSFFSYGNESVFIKSTIPSVTNEHAFVILSCILAKLKDYSKDTFEFFRGPISLIKAFNYIQSKQMKQKHNPLEDAIMLQKIYEYTQTHKPLKKHPFRDSVKEIFTYPSGRFICEGILSNKKEIRLEFDTIHDAINWICKEFMNEEESKIANHKNIIGRIMTAARKKTKYCGLKWTRISERK